MRSRLFLASLCATALVTVACGDDSSGSDAGPPIDGGATDGGGQDGGAPDSGMTGACTVEACPDGLPVRQSFDSEAAERGRQVLHEGGLAQPFVPKAAFEYLWLVWGTGVLSGEAFWAEFRERYGFIENPDSPYPLGIEEANASTYSMNCLTCHAGKVAGEIVIGGSNDLVDLQGLYDDLIALNNLAPTPVNPPYTVENMTGAAGANDAFGLGMKLSQAYGPAGATINTEYGFQQPPAWWTIRFKDRIYTDGSGQSDGYRTMMATLLAFGLSYSELQSYDDEFADLHQYLLSLPVPQWPFDPPDEAGVSRGRVVFQRECAACHGTYGSADARYPDRVVDVGEVGTDSIRVDNFGPAEEAWINGSWFGETNMQATGGYLAPVLVGVWATAPYFHNGSVPDLAGVLDPSVRPLQWRRTGNERDDYDPTTVGWKYEIAGPTDGSTLEGRKVYDTTRTGLGKAGHDYGASLTEAERTDVLEYLKTL